MAVEPLYNADLATLLLKARISKADDPDTLAAVHQAVTDVRLGFFSSLGKTRALQIAGYDFAENPETDEEILRSTGVSAEALWLTILLVQRLPVLFMDNTAIRDVFNDEQITRDANSKMAAFIKDMKAQLDQMLGEMASPDEPSNTSVKASLNGPATTYLLDDYFIGGLCSGSY